MQKTISTEKSLDGPFAANMTWGVLVVMTLVTFVIAERGLSGIYIVSFLMMGMLIKGHLIVDVFMGLGNVKRHWRWLMRGYLLVLIGLIFLAYWLNVGN